MSPGSSPRATLRTPFCDLLGIRHPVVQAPMAGGWTTPELVSEVSNAGGLGVLAGARVSPDRLREEIRAVKARTDRPFGVNFLLVKPEEGNRDVAAAQRFLDRFREELGLPPGTTELALSPSPLAAEDIYAECMNRGEAGYLPLLAGQGLGMLEDVQGAAEIFAGLVEEAGDVLSRLRSG